MVAAPRKLELQITSDFVSAKKPIVSSGDHLGYALLKAAVLAKDGDRSTKRYSRGLYCPI